MDGQLPRSCHCTVTSCLRQQQPGGVRNVEREDDVPGMMDEMMRTGDVDEADMMGVMMMGGMMSG